MIEQQSKTNRGDEYIKSLGKKIDVKDSMASYSPQHSVLIKE